MGSCFSGYEGAWPEFFRQTLHRARKQHRCCECGKIIRIGEEYEYSAGKWDGDVTQYRTCFMCSTIRNAACSSGFTFEMLWEDIYEECFVDDLGELNWLGVPYAVG